MPTTRIERTSQVPAAEGNALLALQDLKTQPHVKDRIYKAVGGVRLEVSPGRCLGIIGESGSDKSMAALSLMSLVA